MRGCEAFRRRLLRGARGFDGGFHLIDSARLRWLGGKIHAKPSEIFREHVWVAPFWEESVAGLAGTLGVGRVLFGSDWPHPEGVPQPLDFLAECDGLDAPALRRVLRGNAAELLGLAA